MHVCACVATCLIDLQSDEREDGEDEDSEDGDVTQVDHSLHQRTDDRLQACADNPHVTSYS